MNDLVWVGNTLYPRWLVIAVPSLAFIALVVSLAFIAAFIEQKIGAKDKNKS
jgi:hypothetical protein